MAQSDVCTLISNKLGDISGNPLKRRLTDPKEAVNLADFPMSLVYIPDDATFTFSIDSHAWKRHRYDVRILIFVGAAGATNYPELKSRAILWPDRLGSVLTPDTIKRTSSVVLLGGADTDTMILNYRIGEIQWSDGNNYYGLTATMPILERTDWG